jgi:RHS repeat-associated protein
MNSLFIIGRALFVASLAASVFNGSSPVGSSAVPASVGSTLVAQSTNDFAYDLGSWNLLAILTPDLTRLQSFVWGNDLSGTPDGAGGIGGLLSVRDHTTSTTHFVAYDGNGNVMGLVSGSGTPTARYEYSPFGELLRRSGPAAALNPFRFSTKYYDEESRLSYYGYRYYSANLGRWINRDPIGEDGGPNLYAFVLNNPISGVDPSGQITFVDILVDIAGESSEKAAQAARGLTLKSRVRNVVQTLNAIESFKAGYDIASDMLGLDGTDMLGVCRTYGAADTATRRLPISRSTA